METQGVTVTVTLLCGVLTVRDVNLKANNDVELKYYTLRRGNANVIYNIQLDMYTLRLYMSRCPYRID